MSREKLFLARAEVLALSAVPAAELLDRTLVDAAIRSTVRRHGTVRACVAALAEQFGDRPETTSVRIRWARDTVASLYTTAA